MSSIPTSVVNPYVGEFLAAANPQPPTDQPTDRSAMKVASLEQRMRELQQTLERLTFTVQDTQLGEGDDSSSYCKLR